MPARKQSATAQLKTRLREPLRAQLEAAAKKRGVTLNAEIVDRLESSLKQEVRFGGPELERFALTLINVFEARGKPEDPPKGADWIRDKDCYVRGMFGVVEALCLMLPEGVTAGEIAMHAEEMRSRVLTYVANRAFNE